MAKEEFEKNVQYYKFCAYGFLKDLRFYEPFMMLFFLEKGLDFLQIGSLYALREIAINVMEIPSGVIADVLGRRRVMAVSFLSYILSFVVFFASRSYGFLALAMLAYAFGDAFRTGTHKAMIFDYLESRQWAHLKTHYYGHTRAWSQRGAAVSALIAAALVFWQGSYAPVFLFTIIPYVLDLLLILSYPAFLDGSRSTKRKTLSAEVRSVLASLKSSLANPDAVRAIANQSLYSGYYKACKDYIQPLLKAMALVLPVMGAFAEQERTAVLGGLVYSLLFVLTSIASSSAGSFSRRFSSLAVPLNLTLYAGIVFGFASGILNGRGLLPAALIVYPGIFIIENLRKPMGIAYVSERMKADSLASALSVESQAETLAAALIAVLLGFLSSRFGPGIALAIVSAVCFILAIVLRLPIKKDAERR